MKKMIEGEINNFIMVWTIATISLSYSYTIGKIIPKGRGRLIALFPTILILLILPIRLTSISLLGITFLFLSWLSTFKLLLFAFSKGPLSPLNPPLSFLHFLLLASFPIKLQQNVAPLIINQRKLVFMIILFASSIPLLYGKKEIFHPMFKTLLCTLNMSIGFEISFALIATTVRKLVKVELEQPFDKPHLSTSVQDFWGRRWNLIVKGILHPTIYEPMVKTFSHVIGRKWAPLPAVLVTFVVSGLMHEVIFYHFKRETTTWETWEPCWDSMFFFLIHGVIVALQIAYNKLFEPKHHKLLPRVVSCILTMAFVMSTSVCLFIPAYIRSGGLVKSERDFFAIRQFVNNLYIDYINPLFPFN